MTEPSADSSHLINQPTSDSILSLKRKSPPIQSNLQSNLTNSTSIDQKLHKKSKTSTHTNPSSIPQSKPVINFDKLKPSIQLKQKPLELSEVSNAVKKDLVCFTEHLESRQTRLDLFTDDHLFLIARLVHESDKSLSDLAQYVHCKLLPQSGLIDDEAEKPFDPLPLSMLESAILQVATRVNHGLCPSDVDWLQDGFLDKFAIWRWEAKHRDKIIPPELSDKYEKRWIERQSIKSELIAHLSNLTISERETLIKKLQGPQKRKPKPSATSTSKSETMPPPTSQEHQPSSSQPPPSGQLKSPDQSKPPTKLELAKLAREEKRKAKEEALQAAENQKKKMGNLMSGWISKATPSTPVQKKAANVTPLDTPPPLATHETKAQRLSDFQRVFKPFNVKPNAGLAPINRFRHHLNPTNASTEIERVPDLTLKHSLNDFLCSISPVYKLHSRSSCSKAVTVRDIVNGLAENEMSGSIEGVKRWRRTLKNRSQVPVKYLKFHEDVRPGYIGTWSKTSRLVNGRAPFGRETCLLDYDYDSEGDWVEDDGEDGEDLAGSEHGGEDEEEATGSDSDEDGWLVGDDEEIEQEGQEESERMMVDDAQVTTKTTKKIKSQARRRILGPLIPVVKGPLWESKLGVVEVAMFEPFRIQFINDARVGLNPFAFVSKTSVPLPRKASIGVLQNQKPRPLMPTTGPLNQVPIRGRYNKQGFPNEFTPKLIEMVDGNRKAKPLLIEELRLAFADQRISKSAIERKLSEVAVKMSGVWRVVEKSSKMNHGVVEVKD